MDSILFLIAQFMTPFCQGLDIVPHEGKVREYLFNHSVGVFLVRLEKGKLWVELAFRTTHLRCAGDYLEAVKAGLAQGLETETEVLEFKFERHHHIGSEPGTDFHASTYTLTRKPKKVDPAPAPPLEP